MDGSWLSILYVTLHLTPFSVWSPALTLLACQSRDTQFYFQKKMPPVSIGIRGGRRWGGGRKQSSVLLFLTPPSLAFFPSSTFTGSWCPRFVSRWAALGYKKDFFLTAPQLRTEFAWFCFIGYHLSNCFPASKMLLLTCLLFSLSLWIFFSLWILILKILEKNFRKQWR